jgi:hypothetical protein
VGPERLLPLADDGTSHPIADPLADGVYYATSYDVASDGASVQFQLARFYDVEACVATMDTVPSGTVDASGCYGGWVDTSATAVVTMPVDPAVPVILVSFDYRYYEVTAEEFARLLRGEPPSPEAPAGYEFQPYWRAMVDVEAGAVVRANQQPSS